MSIRAKIFGAGAAKTIDSLGNALDKVFTSKGEKLSYAEAMVRLKQIPNLKQLDVNKAEASHRSWFVAGWRPFIGWVCGVGLGVNYVLRPIFNYTLILINSNLPLLESLDIGALIPLVSGMLGLSILRSNENQRTSLNIQVSEQIGEREEREEEIQQQQAIANNSSDSK